MALRNLTDGKRVSGSIKAFEDLQRVTESILSRYQEASESGGAADDQSQSKTTRGEMPSHGAAPERNGRGGASTASEPEPINVETPVGDDDEAEDQQPHDSADAATPYDAATSTAGKRQSDIDKFRASLEALRASLRESRSFRPDTPTEKQGESGRSSNGRTERNADADPEIPPLRTLDGKDRATTPSDDPDASVGEPVSALEQLPTPKADRSPTPVPGKYQDQTRARAKDERSEDSREYVRSPGSLEAALKQVRESVSNLEPRNGSSTIAAPTAKPGQKERRRPLSDGIPKSVSEDLPKFRGKPRTRICNRCGHETKLRNPRCDKCGRIDESLGILDSVIAGDLAKVEQILLVRPHLITVRTSRHEWTLLHMAASGGNPKMVELLIRKGAALNSTNRDGKTPLHYAAGKGHLKIVEILLEYHADPDTRYHNKTAADLAREHGQQEVAEFLDRIASRDAKP